MSGEEFNEDYYERGVQKKISGYTNYKWMPTRSYPEALTIKGLFPGKTILDFGCAKGFLVHALRQLNVEAYGYDISEYAVSQAFGKAKDHILTIMPSLNNKIDNVVIAKDVFEHIPKDQMGAILNDLAAEYDEALVVVPLGDKGHFRIREYEMDVTHIVKEDEDWWINKFKEYGWKIKSFSYNLPGMKDHWTKTHLYGNGFFILESVTDES